MSILVLQHSDIVGPGRIGVTLRDHGFKLDIRRPDIAAPGDKKNHVPADLDNIRGLVILGGAANVTDIARYPWMQREVDLIKLAHAAQLPVMGICLGCQLIAHALGGQVAPKDAGPDLGFFPMAINTTGQVDTILSGIAWNHRQLFSCGQEVKQLPPGATLLASTPTTKNACFKVGLRTIAFQFHPECDREMAAALLDDAPVRAASRRSEAELTAELESHYEAYARLSSRLAVNLATYLFPFHRLMSA
jgi:GMP synthase (glutamine-hydrolysing)